MWIMNSQMFKLVLEKAEEPDIKLPTSIGSQEKQESSRKTSTSSLLTMPKTSTVGITTYWKILKEMGIPQHLTCLLRNLNADQEATIRTRHGPMDWFQIGKEYAKAVYCHPAYLTYMQSTSHEMWGWVKHRLEWRLLGDISITSGMHITQPYGRKLRKTKEPLKESEREEWKSWLKTQHSKN